MFNQRSTPKKIHSPTEENNMKTSSDVIYEQFHDLKNEMNSKFTNYNKTISKFENSMFENTNIIKDLTDKIDKLTSEQKKIKDENECLKKHCDNLQVEIENFKNINEDCEKLKSKVDKVFLDVNLMKNQSSLEDMIKKSLTESTDKIKSSMEDNMNRINNLFITNFTNQKILNEESILPQVESITPEVSINETIPSDNNLSNKKPQQTSESSAFILNKEISLNINTLPNSSPLKDNKGLTEILENQNINNVPASGKSLFTSSKPFEICNSNSNQGTTTPSLFGVVNKPENNQSLFGSKTSTNSLFGNKTGSLFGSAGQTNNLFGDNKPVNKESIFGNSSESNKSSLFNSKIQTNLFNTDNNNKSMNSDSLFGVKTQPIKIIDTNKESSSNLFGGNSISQTVAADQSKQPFSFSSAASSNMPSFNSLSQFAKDSSSFSANSEATWQGGSKLFANNKLNTSENEEPEQNQEEDHDPHFQPIIELPPLVALQKDEESNEILFRSRCKLYRFIGNEWKERGVGEMKIMRTKESVDPTRPVKLLMRRDQVRKICCNQRISRNVPTFAEMPNVKSTCWVGNDFSEGEPTQEKFAVRFSHVDELTLFKKIVEDIQAEMSSVEKND